MSKTYKLAFITGATSGIGEALCYLLEEKGIKLITTGRNEKKLKALGHPYFVADLSKPEERKKLFAFVKSKKPDLWINNAGFGFYGPLVEMDDEKINDMIEVNITALTEGTKEALSLFIDEKIEGTVVNIGSIASRFTMPLAAVYSATKAYVDHFCQSVDVEARLHNCRVLSSLPGVVKTDFQNRAGGRKVYNNLTMTQEFAAKAIWHQIKKEKGVYGFDWRYRFLSFITKYFIPKSFTNWLIYRDLKKSKEYTN